MVRHTSSSQDACTHQSCDSYRDLKNNMRYASDTNILKTRSEVKVTVTQKWYGTFRHPKMHQHTKFPSPTTKNIGDMHGTRSGTDGWMVTAITICLPKFVWGIKLRSLKKMAAREVDYPNNESFKNLLLKPVVKIQSNLADMVTG